MVSTAEEFNYLSIKRKNKAIKIKIWLKEKKEMSSQTYLSFKCLLSCFCLVLFCFQWAPTVELHSKLWIVSQTKSKSKSRPTNKEKNMYITYVLHSYFVYWYNNWMKLRHSFKGHIWLQPHLALLASLLSLLVEKAPATSGWDEAHSLIPHKPLKMCIWKKKYWQGLSPKDIPQELYPICGTICGLTQLGTRPALTTILSGWTPPQGRAYPHIKLPTRAHMGKELI